MCSVSLNNVPQSPLYFQFYISCVHFFSHPSVSIAHLLFYTFHETGLPGMYDFYFANDCEGYLTITKVIQNFLIKVRSGEVEKLELHSLRASGCCIRVWRFFFLLFFCNLGIFISIRIGSTRLGSAEKVGLMI